MASALTTWRPETVESWASCSWPPRIRSIRGSRDEQVAIRLDGLVGDADDQIGTFRGQGVDRAQRGAIGIGASHRRGIVALQREAEQPHLVARDTEGVPGQHLRQRRPTRPGAVAGDPFELRGLDSGDQRVDLEVEFMVAEGGVVELGRVEGRDHLSATVILGQHARTEEIAGQDEARPAPGRPAGCAPWPPGPDRLGRLPRCPPNRRR